MSGLLFLIKLLWFDSQKKYAKKYIAGSLFNTITIKSL